jgi:hypothetical protein
MRAFAAVLLALSACASSHPSVRGGPRGLHVDDHLRAAREHEEAAARATRWPDVRSAGPGGAYMPWTRSWDAGDEHERLAAIHRGEASALLTAYTDACGNRTLNQVAISPLMRYSLGGWNTSTGVILYLSADAGPADRLLADLRCHRAWMMLTETGMDDCPLDLPGITLDAHGEGENAVITVAITIADPQLVGELQRRTAHELEQGARLREAH